MSDHIPPIQTCIDSIKEIGFDRFDQGSAAHSKLFTLCIAFSFHLSHDGQYMDQWKGDTFPSINEIPAMRAVIEDSKLFKIFLSMLSSKPMNAQNNNSNHTSMGGKSSPVPSFGQMKNMSSNKMIQTDQKLLGRKRSLSTNSEGGSVNLSPSRKAFKMKSPLQNGKDSIRIPIVGSGSSVLAPPLGQYGKSSTLDVNFSVLAAVIFQTTFRYMRHWPAIFMKLYAEDCFGPRIWVDDERCRIFVQNLATSVNSNDPENYDSSVFVKSFDSFLNEVSILQNQDIDSDSDSGDEVVLEGGTSKIVLSRPIPSSRTNSSMRESDESSSSGEEEEESVDGDVIMEGVSPKNKSRTLNNENLEHLREELAPWWKSGAFIRDEVRNRYFGTNKSLGYNLIGCALSNRLEEKVKQNSNLLAALPAFVSISQVRKLAASQLEKWLQSPALSGLARKLFTAVVTSIENIDPPKFDDVFTIKSILSMKVKANQFQAHKESVIKIVKKVPTKTVCRQVILHLLHEELQRDDVDGVKATNDNQNSLQLLKAVLQNVSQSIRNPAVAASILDLVSSTASKDDKKQIITACILLGKIVKILNGSYDGTEMVKAILSESVSVSIQVKCRLIIESMILMVPPSLMENDNRATDVKQRLASELLTLRKLLLNWILLNFDLQDEEEDAFEAANPKCPVFISILDGVSKPKMSSSRHLLIYILLLLVEPTSEKVQSFLFHENIEDVYSTKDINKRLQICYALGHDIDNELIRMIVDAAIVDKKIGDLNAVTMIETFLFHCRKDSLGKISIDDESLLWDMYRLSEFNLQFGEGEKGDIERIACPGLWWRVTVICLILCGSSPQTIGWVMWKENPTLGALMKMSVSNKFRFPTVDCDEEKRDKMKSGEQSMRDQELQIAELLFLTPDDKKTLELDDEIKLEDDHSFMKATRTSARQREKMRKEREARLQEEILRRKTEKARIRRTLKDAQKTITLWNPRGSARKPPKKSVDLIFSACEMFQLADSFIHCNDPDFIINTIGSTDRDSIERAYDWLIPTISAFPTVIDRLPPSASCFLLLRAYNQDSAVSNDLLELALPLLSHVQKSILGEYGEEGAKRAADLLFFDIADPNADRRICSRRVLSETLGSVCLKSKDCPVNLRNEFSWLVAILEIKFSGEIIPSVLSRIIQAAFLERGKILYVYLSALHYFSGQGVEKAKDFFDGKIFELLASRSNVCSTALERHPDMLRLISNTVINAFENVTHHGGADPISMVYRRDENEVVEVEIPLSLLRASIVLLSNWKKNSDPVSSNQMKKISQILLRREFPLEGASSAKRIDSQSPVLTVTEWVALVKANSEEISMEALHCMPEKVLPRLLLCCGLSRNLFRATLERLDNAGKKSEDVGIVFSEMLAPSSISSWGESWRGSRNTVMRRLLGRLSAQVKDGDSIFQSWLEESVTKLKKTGKTKSNSKKIPGVHDILAGDAKSDDEDIMDEETNQSNSFEALVCLSRVVLKNEESSILENIKQNRYRAADIALEKRISSLPSSTDEIQEPHENLTMAKDIVDYYWASVDKGLSLRDFLIRWIPLLCRFPTDQTFTMLFKGEAENISVKGDTMEIIVTHCLTLWSDETIKLCQDWVTNILRKEEDSMYSRRNLLKCFLVRTSYAKKRVQSLKDATGTDFPHYNFRVEDSSHFVRLAFALVEVKANDSLNVSWARQDWMLLLLLIASSSTEHLEMIIKSMMNEKYKQEASIAFLLPRIILKLYSAYPLRMSLGDANIREMLVQAVLDLNEEWKTWSNPLDSHFESSLKGLTCTSLQKSQLPIQDFVKKYPLFALKHIHNLKDVLYADAISHSISDIERGRQKVAYNDLNSLQYKEREYQVSVVHWGCSFSEPLWVNAIDILLAFPPKVLFTCGELFGLLEILQLYMTLFKVQISVATFKTNKSDTMTITRTRNKFSQFLEELKKHNPGLYSNWATDYIQAMLTKCNIQAP